MKPVIKICGITSVNDAEQAVQAGADFLGLIFVPESPRVVSITSAQEIIKALKGTVKLVGVFQNSPILMLLQSLESLDLDFIQLHGQEPPDYCEQLPLPVIKAFSFQNTLQPQEIRPYLGSKHVQYVLIDKPKSQEALPWRETEALFDESLLLPYFLAGKLTPETVGEAILRFKPDGVDVASGVEIEPGVKDPVKMEAFCRAVKEFSLQGGQN